MKTNYLIALGLSVAIYTGAALAASTTPAIPAPNQGTTVNTSRPSMGNTGPATTLPAQKNTNPQVIGGQNNQNSDATVNNGSTANRTQPGIRTQSGTTSPTRIDETGRVTQGNVPNAPGSAAPARR